MLVDRLRAVLLETGTVLLLGPAAWVAPEGAASAVLPVSSL